jgi:hypothetical protein
MRSHYNLRFSCVASKHYFRNFPVILVSIGIEECIISFPTFGILSFQTGCQNVFI